MFSGVVVDIEMMEVILLIVKFLVMEIILCFLWGVFGKKVMKFIIIYVRFRCLFKIDLSCICKLFVLFFYIFIF